MCMRVESDKEASKGGWLHRLSEPLPPVPPAKEVKKKRDWTEECRRMYEHAHARDKRLQVAKYLQVSCEALDMLRVGIGWDDWQHREFSSWPARDHTGRCIGYIRRYGDGVKRTNKGGSTGVFYTRNWYKHSGPLLIVEGGSDVAACETWKLCSIGRASNTHGGEWIRQMIRNVKYKQVVVIGERDAKPQKRGTVASCPSDCQGCAFCWPGLYGMRKVAGELGGVGVMVPEPFKDIRDLLTNGGLDDLKREIQKATEQP